MTGEEGQVKEKGNVLIVGIKLDTSGRELLTWTLAKFTNAGDHVIALHVAPSLSQADALKSNIDTANQQVDGVFDSIIGVYESFCSIKQVDLQVKVTNGSSLKKVLIEEAKKNNAVKVILGYNTSKPHLGSSFSLAKFCSKRLPLTCSVIVMQHGQVAFEKEGALKSLGDSGVLNTIQRTIRSHSWKGPGHQQADGRRASVSEQLAVIEMGRDDYGNTPCHWPLPSRLLESPISVLQAYKYTSPHMQASKKMSDVESPLSAWSSPTDLLTPRYQDCTNTLGSNDVRINKEEPLPSRNTLWDCLVQNKGGQHYGLSECKFHKSFSVQSGPESALEESSFFVSLERPPDRVGPGPQRDASTNGSSAGWPLLHRSILMTKLNHHRAKSHRMSVVEWALQLPDRPKEILNQHAEFVDKDLPHISSEGREHHTTGKNTPSKCTADAHPCHADTVASKVERLCHKKSCKGFHFEELKSATDNFSLGNMIGKGGCSQVYQGLLPDGYVVAVKCLNASAPDSEEEFLTEVEIISGLHHNRIVQLIGYCVDTQHYLLVYNFASEGNLEQKLHGGKGKAVLSWDARYKVAVGVAEALKYLHDGCTRPVIHRDVKSSNILLSADLEPQLTDFGLAKWAPTATTQITCSDVVGTFGYLAPEYFMFGKVSEKTDVYSFGVVLLELITGRRPIDNANPKGQENLVVWARPLLEDESSFDQLIDPKLEGAYSAGQLKNMMIAAALCLRQSLQLRPRMSRILKLLTGEIDDLEHIGRQESVCKESDDGYDMPNYGDTDIRTHLTLALLGLDDDAASQGSIDHSVNLAHSNKFLEEYLGGRYSRSSSFE